MKFIFWQNIISIHQSAFLKALAEEHEVTLVVEQELDNQRKNESWNIPDMGASHIIIAPSDKQIEKLFENNSIYHIFSGINAYPMVYKAFKMAVKRNYNISVMAEPYDWTGLRGKLRRLKYMMLFARYGRYIDHFFTTGNYGIKCYRKAGFPLWKLHQWGYFTEQTTTLSPAVNGSPKIIFVGKIDTRKNILSLISALNEIPELYEDAYIIGTGPLVKELKIAIGENPKIHYLGALPNNEVKQLIGQCDLLVLPSQFDGWGAVVNEALFQGTRVLCSDMCGAGILLDGDKRGGVFQLNESALKQELKRWLIKGPLSLLDRTEIKKWAETSISGEVASDYFVEKLNDNEIIVPWITPPRLKNVDLIFVGRFDNNKNILSILDNFNIIQPYVRKFTIVGSGPLNSKIIAKACQYDEIIVAGRLRNQETQLLMKAHDYLILPSLYDGWGAVINEALSQGTRVLCSEACGASVLLDGVTRGGCFMQTSAMEFIRHWCEIGPVTSEQRDNVRSWAVSNIGGKTASEYFVKVICGEAVEAPWIN